MCLLLPAVLVVLPPPAVTGLSPQPLAAQETPAERLQPAPRGQELVSPGGAFLRSLLVPGWGHAATGSFTRGGFYFLAEAGTAWMLFRTGSLRGSARRVLELRAEAAEARLVAEGTTDPDTLRVQVADDPSVQEARALVDARGQHFEDWAALAIFFVLIGAADAFVSGHLQEFPAPLSIRTAPTGLLGERAVGGPFPHPRASGRAVRGGGALERLGPVEIGVTLPWGGPWGRSGSRR